MTAKRKGPGKAYRQSINPLDVVRKFDTEEKAEAWFVEQRWPDGIVCPHCGGNNIATVRTRKPQPWRCRTCRKHFSVKTKTIMHSANIPLRQWAIAIYLYSTSLKGVSSMKLHRDFGITQRSAWYMGHRLREMWDAKPTKFDGPVEEDETYIGGKEANKHESRKLHAGRGTVGKTAVAGIRDRDSGRVRTTVVRDVSKRTLQRFIGEHVHPEAMVYTDEHKAYANLPFQHRTVSHSVGEFVNDMAHTNGIESHWAMLKRGYIGVYHQMSVKHLARYIHEFEGRHNVRKLDTRDQMSWMAKNAKDKRMTYASLTARQAH